IRHVPNPCRRRIATIIQTSLREIDGPLQSAAHSKDQSFLLQIVRAQTRPLLCSQLGHFSNLPVVGFRQCVVVCWQLVNFPVDGSRHCLALAGNAAKANVIVTITMSTLRYIVASVKGDLAPTWTALGHKLNHNIWRNRNTLELSPYFPTR